MRLTSNTPFFNTKTPDTKLNFFQNYGHHINHLEKQFNAFLTRYSASTDKEETLQLLSDETLQRLTIFESLHDGHDYADEVLGASVVPVIGISAAAIFSIKALWELSLSAAVYFGAMKNDGTAHTELALRLLTHAAVAVAIAAFSFFKSVTSVITRPIATLVQGLDKQKPDRFLSDEDAKMIDRTGMNNIADLVFPS